MAPRGALSRRSRAWRFPWRRRDREGEKNVRRCHCHRSATLSGYRGPRLLGREQRSRGAGCATSRRTGSLRRTPWAYRRAVGRDKVTGLRLAAPWARHEVATSSSGNTWTVYSSPGDGQFCSHVVTVLVASALPVVGGRVIASEIAMQPEIRESAFAVLPQPARNLTTERFREDTQGIECCLKSKEHSGSK